MTMKTIFQVYSRLKGTKEWLEDRLPFNSLDEAKDYIGTQWKNTHQYKIVESEEFETASEELDYHDAWDAIGGDWEG